VRKVKLSFVVVALVASVIVASPPEAGWASPGAPSAPKSVRLVPGNARVNVTWTAPYSDGGHKVTAYKVTTYHDEVALAVNVFRSTKTTETIVGLTNGKAYTFTVAAKNSSGWSRFSARSPSVKVGIPVAPAKPTSVPGTGSATVTWRAPVSNGNPINWYRITPYLAGHTMPGRIFMSSKTREVMTTLQHGKRYQFKVAAHNKIGWSAPSPVSATIVVK
jgi:Fibronectin type III domain